MSYEIESLRLAIQGWEDHELDDADFAEQVKELCTDHAIHQLARNYLQIYGEVMNEASHDDIDAPWDQLMGTLRKYLEEADKRAYPHEILWWLVKALDTIDMHDGIDMEAAREAVRKARGGV